jgi:hypothetical protein
LGSEGEWSADAPNQNNNISTIRGGGKSQDGKMALAFSAGVESEDCRYCDFNSKIQDTSDATNP